MNIDQIKVIGVIGAGVMGVGVAHAFAEYGYQVIVVDRSKQKLEQAKAALKESFMLQKFSSGSSQSELSDIEARILWTSDLGELKAVDFIVENITEKMENKLNLYQQMNLIVSKEVCIAVNTSCIPIDKLSGFIDYPQRVLGMHFMNPVPLKKVVEVIKGEKTSIDTLALANELLGTINKRGIVVNDSPGFALNRVFMLTINEAVHVLEDGIASAEDIDDLFMNCLGHKMGPLATADLIGLDTVYDSLIVLKNEFNDSKYEPARYLKKMITENKLGKKNKAGFYKY